jgi:rubrerythrin
MSRYIDAEKVMEEINRIGGHNLCEWETIGVKALIDRQPTADVVEVRHGEWIEKDDGWDGVMYTCSVCRCDWTTIDGTPFENNMRYCPECGAKMDEERKD